ncbi:MAG: hypothetical protein LBM99_01460 [Bacillales bacterium]|jgi:hypothetical protein|nr:hypothetical protein [Bacillales bacterium]
MKKTTKKLIASSVALGLAAVTTVGSTYAWFALNTTVSVRGINMTVKAGNELLVHLAGTSPVGTEKAWSNSIDLSRLFQTNKANSWNFADVKTDAILSLGDIVYNGYEIVDGDTYIDAGSPDGSAALAAAFTNKWVRFSKGKGPRAAEANALAQKPDTVYYWVFKKETFKTWDAATSVDEGATLRKLNTSVDLQATQTGTPVDPSAYIADGFPEIKYVKTTDKNLAFQSDYKGWDLGTNATEAATKVVWSVGTLPGGALYDAIVDSSKTSNEQLYTKALNYWVPFVYGGEAGATPNANSPLDNMLGIGSAVAAGNIGSTYWVKIVAKNGSRGAFDYEAAPVTYVNAGPSDTTSAALDTGLVTYQGLTTDNANIVSVKFTLVFAVTNGGSIKLNTSPFLEYSSSGALVTSIDDEHEDLTTSIRIATQINATNANEAFKMGVLAERKGKEPQEDYALARFNEVKALNANNEYNKQPVDSEYKVVAIQSSPWDNVEGIHTDGANIPTFVQNVGTVTPGMTLAQLHTHPEYLKAAGAYTTELPNPDATATVEYRFAAITFKFWIEGNDWDCDSALFSRAISGVLNFATA